MHPGGLNRNIRQLTFPCPCPPSLAAWVHWVVVTVLTASRSHQTLWRRQAVATLSFDSVECGGGSRDVKGKLPVGALLLRAAGASSSLGKSWGWKSKQTSDSARTEGNGAGPVKGPSLPRSRIVIIGYWCEELFLERATRRVALAAVCPSPQRLCRLFC